MVVQHSHESGNAISFQKRSSNVDVTRNNVPQGLDDGFND